MTCSSDDDLQAAAIRRLNDAFRTSLAGGRIMLTAGVNALAEGHKAAVLNAVRQYSGFTPANDPHGEHDFGALDVQGTNLLWKIDYYDTALAYGSENPADPEATTRVLTIMLQEEY